jgi:hypothetical protein
LRDLSLVQTFDRSLKSGLRHMTEGACLVPIDRERLVAEQDLAEARYSLRAAGQQGRDCSKSFGLDTNHLLLALDDLLLQ